MGEEVEGGEQMIEPEDCIDLLEKQNQQLLQRLHTSKQRNHEDKQRLKNEIEALLKLHDERTELTEDYRLRLEQKERELANVMATVESIVEVLLDMKLPEGYKGGNHE